MLLLRYNFIIYIFYSTRMNIQLHRFSSCFLFYKLYLFKDVRCVVSTLNVNVCSTTIQTTLYKHSCHIILALVLFSTVLIITLQQQQKLNIPTKTHCTTFETILLIHKSKYSQYTQTGAIYHNCSKFHNTPPTFNHQHRLTSKKSLYHN